MDIFDPSAVMNCKTFDSWPSNLITVLNHYDVINTNGNPNLDPRLRPNGIGQQLNMTQTEKDAVIAFLNTLAGANVYTDEKWSDPFIN